MENQLIEEPIRYRGEVSRCQRWAIGRAAIDPYTFNPFTTETALTRHGDEGAVCTFCGKKRPQPVLLIARAVQDGAQSSARVRVASHTHHHSRLLANERKILP